MDTPKPPAEWTRLRNGVQQTGASRSKIYEIDKKYGGVLKNFEGLCMMNLGRFQQLVSEAGTKATKPPKATKPIKGRVERAGAAAG
jgi:hypothetical protein